MSRLKFTVVLPTTGNRGALLPYSIGSIQNQTIQDFEIFIIGDGLADATKELIRGLMAEDSRIKLFDHPKHERRGEPYRHQALQEADSDFVCYLCDRDMMLPNHLETLLKLLQTYNFASTTFISVKEDQSVILDQYITYYGAASDNDEDKVRKGHISLSNVGHTFELYHQLPHGWRTTPEHHPTDIYMWKQFQAHPKCNAISFYEPTIMYFKRGNFPGASVAEREKDLKLWADKIKDQDEIERIKGRAIGGLILEKNRLQWFKKKFSGNHPLLIKGYTPREALGTIYRKVANRLTHL